MVSEGSQAGSVIRWESLYGGFGAAWRLRRAAPPSRAERLFTGSPTAARMRQASQLCAVYLPGSEVNRDHEGGSSRARPYHCTSVGLTPASIPNADTSGVQFLVVGTAFALSRTQSGRYVLVIWHCPGHGSPSSITCIKQ